ncbi:phage tail tape measure protein [Cupriavidus sp. BIC8F]|uniref:phage tail tape measure protein n=1 Tax=Cupriavidus sp. BIC8F TaxID=3079014 RepID=UPI0029171474|nr:phage tail tape measure protein [Cupriavidus sp. BIC8F]
MTDLNVALRLTARDQLSRPAVQSLQTVRTESQRLFQARETLAVRSEQRIAREIRQTELAYQRLATAGTVSAREQARAYDAMRSRVTELRRELGQVSALQRTMGAVGAGVRGLQGAAGVGAGLAGAAYIVSRPAGAQMSWDRRLAAMANTAFADRGVEGRIAGQRTLEEAVKSAVRTGGGTKDQAAETLDQVIASGAVGVGSAIKMLPTLQKYATGTGSDPAQLAQIAIRAMQTFRIREEDFPKALDMALVAGQAGGFELKDMAKWLPQQMAAGRNAGLSGLEGFSKLLAANQAAVITAGSKDEAGNNLVNLLGKISSADTANDAKKLGIDLSGSLVRARQKGIDPLDAFVGITDKVVSRDSRYTKLQAQLAAQKGGERTATMESMGDLLQGSAIGKLIQDRQALMALVALMNNRDYVKDVQAKTLQASGANEKNFAVITNTASFKAEQLKNEADFAQNSAFTGFNRAVGETAEKLTSYAREYPGLTAAVAGATTALTALAAASAGAGLGAVLRGSAGGAAGGTAGRALATAGRVALPVGAVVAAGAAGYGIGTVLNHGINKVVQGATGQKDASLGSWLYDVLHPNEGKGTASTPFLEKLDKQASAIEALSKAPQPFVVENKVVLDGSVIAEYTNNLNARESRRY